MKDNLPAPLTSPECDLRGYDFMPLFGNRLFKSHLYRRAIRDPRAGLAALKLWWEAWQQCPAGSLPDDDDDLAMLADFGLDTKAWLKVKELAMHGFVKCNDGRLYHPVLCTEAIEAYERRRRERERKAAHRAKRQTPGSENEGRPEDVPRDKTGTTTGHSTGQDAPFRVDRTGQDRDRTGQDKERKERTLPAVGARARGERLADDWTPGADGRAFAGDLHLNPDAVLATFRDYWHAKAGADARKADWPATWRNWCRREAERPRRAARDLTAELFAEMGIGLDGEPIPPELKVLQ